jgi:hypothetical protein
VTARVRTGITATALLAGALLLTAALVPAEARAELRTFLEPRLVDEMDTVRLTIRAEGTSQSDAPDLTPLLEDFELLGNQTSSRISSINGRTIASVEYQISLRPKRTGELVVPSLTIGGERSEEIRLVVRPLDPQLRRTIESMVFFETDLSPDPVYVQGQTVLTRRLFYSQGVQIYSDLPGVPEVDAAVVIPLGETQSRSVVRGGQRYGVIEQSFAIFPEQSGTLTIPAISVTSSVRLSTGGRTRRSGIRVGTEAIEVDVLPIPAAYPANAPWLPATDVRAVQRWEPARTQVDVGTPLNFTLTVRADGNRGSAIPPVPLPLPESRFKIYPEAPEMQESADTGTIVGVRSAAYALIPTSPGEVDIPPIEIVWWDTAADQLRTTRVAVDPVLITGAAALPTQPEPAEAEPAAEPAARTGGGAYDGRTVLAALGIALVLLLMIGGAAFIARLPDPRMLFRWPVSNSPGRRRRQSLAALKASARRGDPVRFRQVLAGYLAEVYGTSPADALHRFRGEPGAADALARLDRALYAPSDDIAPDLTGLVTLARAAAGRPPPAEPVLPPLYG